VSESYEGRQFVGMDLRRRSVLVRMTESGEHLETVRILNDRNRLAEALSRAGESPGVWRAESSNLFVRPFLVGDVATMSVTLMTKSLEYGWRSMATATFTGDETILLSLSGQLERARPWPTPDPIDELPRQTTGPTR
jgi:hypothetical protein